MSLSKIRNYFFFKKFNSFFLFRVKSNILQQKKNKLYVPNIKKLNINFYSDVSEKVKVQKQPDGL